MVPYTTIVRSAQPTRDQGYEGGGGDQCGGDDQTGVGDQTVMVEGGVIAVDGARYWPHRKCLPMLGER